MIALRAITLILLVLLAACDPTVQKPETTKQNTSVAESPAPKVHTTSAESGMVASLIDPAKLATLKDRGSNPRILKITAILYVAKVAGKSPEEIVGGAVRQIGWAGTEKGRMTSAVILRNLDIAEKLGCITDEDISAMRRGKSPAVRKGPYSGDILSVDHIIPHSIAPELDNVIANLELMPLRLNQSKNDSIGPRQRDLAQKLYAAGLLSDPGKVR